MFRCCAAVAFGAVAGILALAVAAYIASQYFDVNLEGI